jgi:hypothetical protein
MDPNWGWWAAAPVGAAFDPTATGPPDGWINVSHGAADVPLLLPPGEYDVLWKTNLQSPAQRIAERVTVRAGQLHELDIRVEQSSE